MDFPSERGQASNGGKACGTRYPDPPLALEELCSRDEQDRLMTGLPCKSNNYNGDLMGFNGDLMGFNEI